MTDTKKARPYWVTDEVHEMLKNISKAEDLTLNGVFKTLIAEYLLKKSKEEK